MSGDYMPVATALGWMLSGAFVFMGYCFMRNPEFVMASRFGTKSPYEEIELEALTTYILRRQMENGEMLRNGWLSASEELHPHIIPTGEKGAGRAILFCTLFRGLLPAFSDSVVGYVTISCANGVTYYRASKDPAKAEELYKELVRIYARKPLTKAVIDDMRMSEL